MKKSSSGTLNRSIVVMTRISSGEYFNYCSHMVLYSCILYFARNLNLCMHSVRPTGDESERT